MRTRICTNKLINKKKQEKKLTKKQPRSDSFAKIYIFIYIFNIKKYNTYITEPVFSLGRGLYFLLEEVFIWNFEKSKIEVFI